MAVLKQGSKGPEVTRLQKRLNELGFKAGKADGRFGPATKAALIAFQKSEGLATDGIAGPKTLGALKLDAGKPPVDIDKPPAVEPVKDTSGPLANRLLTESDFKEAAELLNCDIAAIKAVAEVESSGNGFLSDGRVKILFEGHQFYKYAKGAYAQGYPTICYKNWTKAYYTKGPNADARGAGELARLQQAMALDRRAALMSASYGKFQIMGFNHKVCGFDDLESFYAAMQVSEGEQLKAFSKFVISNKLDRALRKHDWATFAKGYNGAQYSKNQYDKKLAAAHAKYSKR